MTIFTDDWTLTGDRMYRAIQAETEAELQALWQEANRIIGSNRAPADDLPLLVYGYTQGRLDQMRKGQNR